MNIYVQVFVYTRIFISLGYKFDRTALSYANCIIPFSEKLRECLLKCNNSYSQ